MKNSFENRGGSSPDAQRYYGRKSQAVLPFGERYYRLERYYHSESGTTAGELRRYYRGGRGTTARAEQSIVRGKLQLQRCGRKDDGCDKDVYV